MGERNQVIDEGIVRMLSILREAGVKHQFKVLHDLLCIYESVQLPWEERELVRPRLEDTFKLVQSFNRGDKSVRDELRKRKII